MRNSAPDVTKLKNGLVATHQSAHKTVAEFWIPGGGDAGAERAIERIVGIFLMVASIPDEGKANDGIVNLALQCGGLPLTDITLDVQLLTAVIDEFDLLAVFLRGWHFECPA